MRKGRTRAGNRLTPVARDGGPQECLDPAAAEWVRTIFRWYVADRVPLAEIVRRLNVALDRPRPPRSLGGFWDRAMVVRVLRNPRYRGFWQYGVTESVWKSAQDYAKKERRAKAPKELQVETLRILDDATWYRADDRAGMRRPPADLDGV